MKKVAAIVVNYNGREITKQAVESLRKMTYPAFDLIVLDNASTDGSPEALEQAFPDLKQLKVEVNRGSSSGYAAGFRWAFENGYDYVLLLNNDIEVEPDMLDRLVEVAESDPRIGVVGPKCYFHGDRQRLWSAAASSASGSRSPTSAAMARSTAGSTTRMPRWTTSTAAPS